MSYKRFVRKRGKIYGPYIYESYRDETGKVRKKYFGRVTPQKKFDYYLLFGLFLAVLILGIYSFNFFGPRLTGMAFFNIKDSYIQGENITGNLEVKLRSGELIPGNAKLIVEQPSITREFDISQVVGVNANGSFYIENFDISGEGEGYGFIGEKILYPYVYFTLLFGGGISGNEQQPQEILEENVTENETIEIPAVNETPQQLTTPTQESPIIPIQPAEETTTTPTIPIQPAEEPTTPAQSKQEEKKQAKEEAKEEKKQEKTEKKEEKKQETPTTTPTETPTQPAEQPAGITGAIILENEIYGKVSRNEGFEYLIENQSFSLKNIHSDYENLSGNILDTKTEAGKLTIITNYSYSEKGFGKEYLGKDNFLNISLESLGLEAIEGKITIKLVYNDVVLTEASKEISVKENITGIENETEIEEKNISFYLNKKIAGIKISRNENFTLNLSEYFSGAEGYNFSEPENISFKMKGEMLILSPDYNFAGIRNASITAYSKNDSIKQNFDIEVSSAGIFTKQYKAVIGKPVKWVKSIVTENLTNLSIELPKEAENITIKAASINEILNQADNYEKEIKETDRKSLITGQAISSETAGAGILTRLWRKFRITGRAVEEINSNITETENSKIINFQANASYAVEYYTQAPGANETNISGGKQVIISAPSELNYTDILAYTTLDNIAPVNSSIIKLYWHASYEDAVKYGYVNVNKTIANENKTIANEIINNTQTENPIKNNTIINDTEINATINSSEILNESINNETETTSNETQSLITGNAVLENNENLTENNSENITSERASSEASDVYLIEISYDDYDLDEDGRIDYIEWNVPHLSVQSYSIIFSSANMTLSNITIDNEYSHLTVNYFSSDPPYNSLLGYWSFDADNASTVFDFTNNNYDGVLYGGAVANSTCGVYNDGICLDGNDDWTDLTGLPAFDSITPHTYMAWINLKTLNPSYTWVINNGNTNNGTSMIITTASGNGYIGFFYSGGSQVRSSNTPITLNIWQHIAVVYNGTKGLTFYLNGVLNGTQTTGGSYENWSAVNANPRIGVWTTGSYDFNGSIDEVMIFNTTLNSSQISAIYNNQSARFISQGEQSTRQFNITSGADSVNISFQNYQRNLGSNISARVGVWDSSLGYNNSDFNENNSLAAYWHFDEASWTGTAGEVKDATGLNNGTSAGDADTVPGFYFRGGNFDGDEDYIDISSNPKFIYTNFSISLWFEKEPRSPDSGVPLSRGYADNDKNGDFVIKDTASGKLVFDVQNSDGDGWIFGYDESVLNSGEALNTGQWYHVVVTRNGSTYSFYVDGSLTSSAESGDDISDVDDTNPFRISAFTDTDGTSSSHFNGTIDELMIFNRSLTADEIKELYVKGRALWNYTNWQNLSGNGSDTLSNNQFFISPNTTNILPQIKLVAGPNLSSSFYTPLIIANASNSALMNISNIGAPTIIIFRPVNNSRYNTNVSVALNYSILDTNSQACWYTIDMGVTNTSITSCLNTTLNVSEGIANVTLYSNDSENNLNSVSVSFLTDTIKPTINFTAPTPANSSVQNLNSIYVNLTTNDTNPHYSFVDFDSSLVSWWRFDDVNLSGDVVDYTGRNNGSKQGNAVQNDSGMFGKAFSFDGDGDYVVATPLPSSNNYNISVFGWANSFNSMGGEQHLFDVTGSLAIQFHKDPSSGNLDLSLSSGCLPRTQVNVFSNNNWTYIGYTRVANYSDTYSNYTIYVNGVARESHFCNGTLTNKIYIGILNEAFPALSWNGSIDEVLIFNRSLTSPEVLALYNSTANKYYNNFTNLQDGNHTFTGYAVDYAGNVNSSEKRTIEISSSFINLCSNLSSTGGYYKQIANIIPTSGVCINITAQNVTYDCEGYWISNTTLNTIAIYSDKYNSTIRNCNISLNKTGTGIYLVNSNFSSIINNTINSSKSGISIEKCSFNNITSNIILNTNYSINLSSSSWNNIFNNSISRSYSGIGLHSSSNNNLTGNMANNNTYGIYLYSSSNNNLIFNNTAIFDSTGIYLYSGTLNNLTGNTANKSAYGIYVLSSQNILVNNTANANSIYGIYSNASCTLINNSANNNSDIGIYLESNTGNNLTGNSANSNTNYGIYVNSGNLTDNTAKYNKQAGIYLTGTKNILANNILFANYDGILIDSASTSNNITGNNLSFNTNYAIKVSSSTNNITGNILESNNYGIALLSSSSGNFLYDNLILNCKGSSATEGCLAVNISSSNNVYNGKINSTGTTPNLVYIIGASNNLFSNFVLNNSATYDVFSDKYVNFERCLDSVRLTGCSQITGYDACVVVSSCTSEYDCANDISACSDLTSSSTCSAFSESGCMWEYCSGTMSGCSDINDSSLCDNTNYCSADGEECQNSVTACSDLTSSSACSAFSESGCMWEYCSGDLNCDEWSGSYGDCGDRGQCSIDLNGKSNPCENDDGCENYQSQNDCETNGCYWSGSYCYPECGTTKCCNGYGVQNDCESNTGCSWYMNCDNSGSCEAIGSNSGECDLHSGGGGCSWNSNACGGSITDTDCSQITDSGDCNSNTNSQCSWYNGNCDGSLDNSDCFQFSFSTDCGNVNNCGWNSDSCGGTPSSTDCSHIGDQGDCNDYTNSRCSWDFSSCSGTLLDLGYGYGCNLIGNSDDCVLTSSKCSWDEGNSFCQNAGRITACSQLTTEDACYGAGCSWGAGCSGTIYIGEGYGCNGISWGGYGSEDCAATNPANLCEWNSSYNYATNNVFRNVSYLISKENVAGESELYRQWYYQAFVNNTKSNNLSRVNITAYNITGNYIFNLTTNLSGWTPIQNITQYRNYNGTRSYNNNFTIYARNSTYLTLSHSLNITGNMLPDVFMIQSGNLTACEILFTPNSYYVLNNFSSNTTTCFNITAENITLDCRNWSNQIVYGNSSSATRYYGIFSGKNGTIIRNCEIRKGNAAAATDTRYPIAFINNINGRIEKVNASMNYEGIYILNSTNISIINNSISAIGLDGIIIAGGWNNTLVNNTITNASRFGINLTNSWGNKLENNTAKNNTYGILLYQSGNNTLAGNTANTNNLSGFYLWGGTNNTLINSSAYLNAQYGIFIFTSTNNSISGGNLSDNIIADFMLNTGNDFNCSNNLTDVLGSGNRYIKFYSQPSTISNLLISELFMCNADTSAVNNVSVRGSDIIQNNGIFLLRTDAGNFSNISSYENYYGIYLSLSSNNTFTNLISNSSRLESMLINQSQNNLFSLASINASGRIAVNLAGVYSNKNNFTNLTILNTNSSWFDLNMSTASINDTTITDSYIGNYSLIGRSGVGGTLRFIDTGEGEIRFTNPVNGSGTNLSNDVRITNNSVYVNSTQFGLNKSANITLYNIRTDFINPAILRDGALCSAGMCTNFTSLTAGTVQFNVSSWSNYSIGESTNVYSCRILDRANLYYNQTANIIQNEDEDCIVIAAENVTYDCGGYYLDSYESYVGNLIYSNYSGITIKNCNLNLNSSNTNGINLLGSLNSYLYNISMFKPGTIGTPLKLENIRYSRFEDITFNCSGGGYCDGEGAIYIISVEDSDYNNFTNIRSFGEIYLTNSTNNNLNNLYISRIDVGSAVYLGEASNNNIIVNSTIISSNQGGIFISSSNNTYLSNVTISFTSSSGALAIDNGFYNIFDNINITSGSPDLYISSSSHNLFKNSYIETAVETIDLVVYDGLNNTFLNTTYNLNKERVSSGELIRKWYYKAKVNDTAGNGVSGANLTAYNITGSYNFNLTTNASGWTDIGEIIDYINNGTRRYYSFYMIYAENLSYDYTANHTFNASLGNNYTQLFTVTHKPVVTITAPADGNWTTNRTPTFFWSSSDLDNDDLSLFTYEVNLTCLYSGGGRCSPGDLNSGTITTLNWTTTPYLKYLADNNYYYNWSVRAFDGLAYSNWTVPRRINITSDIAISLPTSTVEFGYMNKTESKNTTTDSPAPLVLRNDGNAVLNISVNFTNIFTSSSNPSNYYQYKIRNNSLGCYIDSGTQTSWAQAPSISAWAIKQLNFTSGYQQGCSNVSVDLLVEIPIDEPAGDKNSTITFTSYLGESGFGDI